MTESCRLITEEQYKEWKACEENLRIAVASLMKLERKSDKFDSSWSIEEQLDWIRAECQGTLYALGYEVDEPKTENNNQ